MNRLRRATLAAVNTTQLAATMMLTGCSNHPPLERPSYDLAKALYARMLAKGKPAKVALIAIAHKLLTIANAMVKNKTTWRHSDVAISA